MRIVIDLQAAQTESASRGIGRCTLALAKAIAKNRGDHDLIIAVSGFFPESIDGIFSSFEGILPKENITIWHALGPVRECDVSNHSRLRVAEAIREHFIASLRPDIILMPSLFEGHIDDGVTTVKCFRDVPTVVLVYDFIPLLNWDTYLGTNAIFAQHYQRKLESLKRADYLLAISNSAASETKTILGVSDEKLTTVLLACDHRFQPKATTDEQHPHVLAKWDITKPFIFYSGGDEPRKNIKGLIGACGLLPDSLKENYQVVLLGKIPDSRVQGLITFARKKGLKSESLRFINHVSDTELIDLYRLCHVFVFPSLHEGFGLPALEAMSCGAAVIGSNTTSLPEVICNPDALFDPTDEVDISKKIAAVLSDESFRLKLKEHGLVQSKQFSWAASAKRTLAALEKFSPTYPKKEDWREFLDSKESDYKTLVASIVSFISCDISQEELANIAACIEKNEQEIRRIRSRSQLALPLTWRIEGPFDSTYSLALLNRETARALDANGHDVILHSTEGPGDFAPSSRFLEENPDIAEFYKRSAILSQAEVSVTSRILYPPRVSDMHSRLNFLHHYAWEESGFPSEWVDDFNQYLDGITYLSKHVEKILVDHGITLLGTVSGSGVDHWERVKPDESYTIAANRFRFLHVSSCFPRKGVDLLLKAYGDSFTSSDDVTLVIKTHPNPHNEVNRLLAELREEKSDFPDVVLIEEDLSDSALKSLYTQCHVLVAPSRAEGFGLPLAEAMLSGLPVITTGWGGQLDFCSSETAWLIDYHFEPAQTHFNLSDSVWAEPSRVHLAQTMREVYELPDEERVHKSALGREILLRDFSWAKVADRLVLSAQSAAKRTVKRDPKIGWVSSWNTRCGIATYSAHLIAGFPEPKAVKLFASKPDFKTAEDAENVIRCWEPHDDEDLLQLSEAIDRESIDVLVVQFNYGFFNLDHFNRFLMDQARAGRVVVLMLHSTIDPAHIPNKKLVNLIEGMKQCHRVMVHSVSDLNRLKKLEVVDNVALFPHAILDFPIRKPASSRNVFKIASFGFFLPHKGLLELMDAVAILHERGLKVSLSMINAEYPAPSSRALIDQAIKKAKKSRARIEIYTTYLSDAECIERMSQVDLVVFPYRDNAESASGAVRCALASGTPVAVTPVPIFDDVAAATYKLSGGTPEEMAESISELMKGISKNAPYINEKKESAMRWRDSHRYPKVSRRLYNMLCTLHREKSGLHELAEEQD